MSKITLGLSLQRRGMLMTFLIVCSLFIYENVFSRKHWNRDYMDVSYIKKDSTILMTFEFFDYNFGPANQNGYLEYCDFFFSRDGVNFSYLMRAETTDQGAANWSWIDMKGKILNADIHFKGCYKPIDGMFWDDDTYMYKVEVYNKEKKAFLTAKWLVRPCFGIKFIRVIGNWHINGPYWDDSFDEVYPLNAMSNSSMVNLGHSPSLQNPEMNKITSESHTAKVSKEADAVVINDVEPGEDIKIYTVSGSLVNATIANNAVVKIKLPTNQIYIVKIGQVRYKVAL